MINENAMTMISTENKNDIILRDYQQEAVSFLNNNDGKLVLAMCPSSGKTETIIHYLNQQYNLNPNLKVLILPHSTNVLLDNFYQRLEARNVYFTYSSDINDDVNVHVILPQNHNKIVGHYNLIIIDEAHENYLAKTIQGIIKKTQAGKEILLTGTPSKFIGNNDFKLHFVALSDLCELYTPKLRIDIIESDYDWNGNYNQQTKELKNSYKFSKESTEISLKKTFDFLLKRNDSSSVEKTLIVCRNIAQSNYVKEYLTSIGFSSEISNSDNDKDSENVAKFKNNLIDILIVVNRARLGYDDADLINLIDISGTLNPNIIYQMFARLLRGTQDMKKYYIRLSSKNDDVYNSEIATSVALMLTHSNYMQVFNGKNFNAQDIIVNSDFFVKSKKSLDKSSGKSKTLSKMKLFIDIKEDDKFDVINFFKEVIEQKEKNVGLYKFCKVTDVLSQLRFNNGKSRTKEECIENAEKYNSVKEWEKNDSAIYSYARVKGWYQDCITHFERNRTKYKIRKSECIEDAKKYKNKYDWMNNSKENYLYAKDKKFVNECSQHFKKNKTKEECIENALKYKTQKEWKEKDMKIYNFSRRNEWFYECTAHMTSLTKKRTKEECIENAKKYNSAKEWAKNDSAIYLYARRKGWYKGCVIYFDRTIHKITKSECIEDAKKYKNKQEWKQNSVKKYNQSRYNNWISECTAHMIKSNVNSKTLQECIEDAKKYSSRKEWGKNSLKYYSYATKHKWLDKCTAHMINLGGKSRTLNECIEDARKYKSSKEWLSNSPSIYAYCSKRNGWLEKCTAHMINLSGKSKTLQECIEDAKKYKSYKSWRKNSLKIYGYCTYHKWLKEIKSLVFNQ
jgi:superfamily II DNA or RNA helicase